MEKRFFHKKFLQKLFVINCRFLSAQKGSPSVSYSISDKERHELIVKKSRFIANISPVQSIEEAVRFINSCRDERASHTCYAYIVNDNIRCSDDGEVSGTAGRPILSSLQSEHMINIAAAVSRHYGGINLGTGGLVRAYGGVVTSCLKKIPKNPFVPSSLFSVTIDLQYIPSLYAILNQNRLQLHPLTV